MTRRLAGASRGLLVAALAIAVTAGITLALPKSTGGHGTQLAVLFQGLIQGMIASLLAAGLVLIFRTSRIINFGALAFGIPGGLLAFELIRFTACPFPIAVLCSLALSAAFGAVAELTFGRRFAKRSRLIFTIATIFISTTLVTVVTPAILNAPFLPPAELRPISVLNGSGGLNGYLPLGGFHFHVGSYPIPFGFPELFTIEMVLVALLSLGLVLRFSKLGVALRSVAENTERAAMLGISTGGITTLAWTIAGMLGGVAVLLIGVTGRTGVTAVSADGATTLLLPLTAAVLARFRSIPVAFLASVLLSILTYALQASLNDPAPWVTGGQLVLLVVGLLLQRRDLFRLASAGEGSWRLNAEERPVPRELASLPGYRAFRYVVIGVALAFLGVLPFVFNAGVVSKMQSVTLLGVIGLSLVVLTGWAGQVSLGQYAFVAVGAVVGGGAADHFNVPFLLALPLGSVAASLLAVAIGLPALRVKGLFLGVATFALAIATTVILFDRKLFDWLIPGAITRPKIFVSFDGETSFYYLCVGAFVLTVLFVRNLRQSRFGRLLIASRDNDSAMQSAGVSIVKTRLQAFAVSGGIAGFGGVMLAFQLRTVSPTAFDAQTSFQLFIYVVLGGVSSILGAMIGVAYLGAINFNLFGSGPVAGYITASLPILILYFAPGGLLAVLNGVRDGALRIVAQRRGLIVPSLFRGMDAAALASRLTPMAPPLPGAGLAALPRDARWSIDSRMHGRPGHALDPDQTVDEESLFAAAAAGIDAEESANELVGVPGAHA